VLDDQVDNDEEECSDQNARFLILEPFIMITNTSIVSSFPCVRRSLFSDSFKCSQRDFSYALVIGNIIHDAFERILIANNFEVEFLEKVFRQAMKAHFC